MIEKYIQEVLGIEVNLYPISKSQLKQLPLYISESYQLYSLKLFNKDILFAALKNKEGLRILQIEKHLQQIQKQLNQPVVLMLENIQAYNRKRLIEKRINFIVPGKQLYLPHLLIDLRESFNRVEKKQKTLMPSAQFLVIYHLLNDDLKWKLEENSFKDIALKFGYSAMAISKAVDSLKKQELIDVLGEREKFIQFKYSKKALWEKVMGDKLLVNPVLKTVFVDEKPKCPSLLKSNESALPEYSNMNASSQHYFAMEKDVFYTLQKSNELVNLNEYEGKYAIEIWKYKPLKIGAASKVVDPLSLYLSMKHCVDERVEMALDQISKEYTW